MVLTHFHFLHVLSNVEVKLSLCQHRPYRSREGSEDKALHFPKFGTTLCKSFQYSVNIFCQILGSILNHLTRPIEFQKESRPMERQSVNESNQYLTRAVPAALVFLSVY
jgi:hypothetical protein